MRRVKLTERRYLKAGEAFHFARRTLEPGPVRILHNHDYFELFWIAVGRVTHLINGENISMTEGEGVLIRPRDLHGFSPQGSEPCQLVNIMFRTETADHLVARYGSDLADRYFWTGGLQPQGFRLDAARQGALDRWAADLQGGPRTLSRIEGFLLALLTQIIPSATDPHRETPPWLSLAIEATRRPAVFRLGAQGLIQAAGRSHEHVCRSMREHLGATPSTFVNQIRMEHAARLLTGTDLSTPEIAADCGLENMSHFHAMFRRHFGLTPRRYRLTHQSDPFQPAFEPGAPGEDRAAPADP